MRLPREEFLRDVKLETMNKFQVLSLRNDTRCDYLRNELDNK